MKTYLVGGAVRDKLLGHPVKEKDWVVVGATPDEMIKQGFRQVGKEFPVFLHPETNEEYALARVERKILPGYKGFAFDASPQVSLEEDLQRRDLTINAMAQDERGDLIDPYHGKEDLDQKLLRHVSPAFAEDPVRILRLGRFLARYAHLGFRVEPGTVKLMRDMVNAGEVDALVAERVWKELERALREPNPEKFFEALEDCGALPRLFKGLSIEGRGIRALKAATALSHSAVIRFAAVLYDLPDPPKAIASLCERYRVPNEYKALAMLTALHYKDALHVSINARERREPASHILKLLSALDIFRRERRFEHFLTTCLAIANASKMAFSPESLRSLAKATQSVDVQVLLDQGWTGTFLAEKLYEARLQKIEEWAQYDRL